MKLIEWSKEFELDLEGIDGQHQSLFSIITRVWQAIVDNAPRDEVLKCLDELERYTAVHFSAEEAFMQAIHYPQWPMHKQEHEHFINRVADERKAVLAGGQLSLDLVRFLQLWLINHIKSADKEYAIYTREQQAEWSKTTMLDRLLSRFI